jgi:NAD(P)H-dependent flavin oxidoreductase YrpB (nitropropane dioxygenase family)
MIADLTPGADVIVAQGSEAGGHGAGGITVYPARGAGDRWRAVWRENVTADVTRPPVMGRGGR